MDQHFDPEPWEIQRLSSHVWGQIGTDVPGRHGGVLSGHHEGLVKDGELELLLVTPPKEVYNYRYPDPFSSTQHQDFLQLLMGYDHQLRLQNCQVAFLGADVEGEVQ